MPLDDLLPDDVDKSSSSGRTGGNSTSETKEFVEEFHSNHGAKKFTEEQWDEIKKIIIHETSWSVGEVKSMQSERRHKVLHELAIEALVEDEKGDFERTDTTCSVCGSDCSYSYIELQDEKFCINHPLIQVAKELDIEVQSDEKD